MGGGSGGLEQDSMVLSAQQLVLIFFIGIINNGKINTLLSFSIVFQLKSSNFEHLSCLCFSVCGIRICSIPICA